jgi:RNA polymerase sigma-70 factor (ECF subfamily)
MSKYRKQSIDEDTELVAAWRRGELSSFETLVRKYQQRLLDIAFRLTGSYQYACEVVQEAFAAAYRARDSLRGSTRFSSWLAGFTVNQCRNLIEPAQTMKRSEGEPSGGTQAGSDYCPVQTSPVSRQRPEQSTLHDRLQDCIKILPVEFREVVVLRDVHDFSYDEMGSILEVPVGTVKSRVLRARELVRDCLKQEGRAVPVHPDVSRRLSAYLENTLTTDAKEEIKRHLGSCGSCREELANLEWTVGHLKSLPGVAPPSWLTEKIMAKLRDRTLLHPSLRRRLFFPTRIKLAIGAAACIVLCAAVYYLVRPAGPRTVPPAAREGTFRAAKARPAARESSGPMPAAPGVSEMPDGAAGLPSDEPAQKLEAVSHALPLHQQALPAGPEQTAKELRLLSPDEERESEMETVHFRPREEKTVLIGGGQREKRVTDKSLSAGELDVSLSVDDPAAAAGTIEKAVSRLGGRITGRAHSGGDELLYTQIDGRKLPELIDRLGRIGRLQGRPQISDVAAGQVDLVIRW